MSWLQFVMELDSLDATDVENALLHLGATSVTLSDASDDPVAAGAGQFFMGPWVRGDRSGAHGPAGGGIARSQGAFGSNGGAPSVGPLCP